MANRVFSEKYNKTCRIIFSVLVLFLSLDALAQKDLPNPPSNFQLIKAGCFVVPMDTIYQAIVPAGQAHFNLKAYGLVNQFLQNGIPVKWAIRSSKNRDDIDFTATAQRYSPGFVAASSMDFRGGPFIVPDTILPCGLSTRQIISNFGNNVAVYLLTNDVTVDIRYTLTHRPKIAVFNNGGNQLIHTKILDAASIPNYDVMDAANISSLINCYTFVSEPHADTNQITWPVVTAVRNFVMNGGNFLAQCHAVNSYENKAFFHTTSGISIVNSVITHLYPNADLAYSQMHGPLQQNEGGSIHNWTLKPGSNWLSYAYRSVSHTGIDTVVAMGAHLIAPSGIGGNVFYLGGHDYSSGGKIKNVADLSTLARVNGLRLYLNGIFVPSRNSNGAWANAGLSANIACTDSVTLGCTLTGPPGSTFLWTPSSGLSCTTCPNPVARPSVTTMYQVQVTNGCIATDTVKVSVAPRPVAKFANTTVCIGASTSFTDQSVSPTFWRWNFGDLASGTANVSSLQNPTHTFSAAGSFKVTLISGIEPACADTIVQTVVVNPLPVLTVNSPTVCAGQTATLTAAGAATYSWSTGITTNPLVVTPAVTTSYILTGITAAGCSSVTTTIVTVIPRMVPVTSNTNVSCFGGSDGTANVTATGGRPGYTYSWNTSPIQTTPLATGLKMGTYTVMIIDSGGCTITASATITEPPLLAATATVTNVKCHGGNDGSAIVTVSGGTLPYSYSWNTSPVQYTAQATGLIAGNYMVTVKDAKSCIVTTSPIVSEPSAVVLTTSVSNVKCYGGNDGSATVTATGGTPGYTYSWNTSPVQTSALATGLRTGTYSVIVTDANACISTTTATIAEPSAVVLTTSVNNVKCYGGNDGSATVTATGGTPGYTYSWNTIPVQTSALAAGLKAGTYFVIVTDANACISTITATVAEPSAVILTTSVSNVKCYGGNDGSATVTATGGTPGYTYSWNTSPVQTSALATGLKMGTYVVTVTDANACIYTSPATITEPSLLTVAAVATDVKCNGGSDGTVLASASGGTAGYSYNWNTSPVQTSALATGLRTGTYSVIVTDANACISTTTATIAEPSAVVLTTSVNNVKCYGGNDGSATVTATGGTPGYTYSWNTSPVQTSALATGLRTGTYSVIVTDANACISTTAVAIAEPPVLTIATVATDVKCFGGNDGSATVTAGGGTPGYTYSWNTTPVQTAALAAGLKAGAYTVTVTDANSCINISTVTVAEPPLIILNTTLIHPTCITGGIATVSVSGGTPPFSNSWNSSPVQSLPTASDLPAGNYIVTVTDANGCQSEEQVTLLPPPLPVADYIFTTGCFGTTTNVFTDKSTVPSGPIASSIVAWNWNFGNPTSGPANTSSDINPTHIYDAAGSFTTMLIVTTDKGCKDTISKPIDVYAVPVVRFGPFVKGCGPLCVNFKDSSSVADGAIQNWLWNFGDPTSSGNTSTLQNPTHCYKNLGVYNVTLNVVTDHGCTATLVNNNMIEVFPYPSVDLGSDQKICSESDPPVIFNAGNPGFKFLWQPTGDTTQSIAVTVPGTYKVTVTNQVGCSSVSSGTVIEVCPPRLFISNSFTPNGDNINDNYNVYGAHFTNFHMFIFNRWGEIIFESKDRNVVWDGIYREVPMPIGVYPWIITYTGDSEEFYGPYRLEGSVTVVR
jgi:gliding motility-associated-like protein